MELTHGAYITGFGMLFRVADLYWGYGKDKPMILIENVENEHFQWIPTDEARIRFDLVNYAS